MVEIKVILWGDIKVYSQKIMNKKYLKRVGLENIGVLIVLIQELFEKGYTIN